VHFIKQVFFLSEGYYKKNTQESQSHAVFRIYRTCRSGYRRAKKGLQKIKIKTKIFNVLKSWMFSLESWRLVPQFGNYSGSFENIIKIFSNLLLVKKNPDADPAAESLYPRPDPDPKQSPKL
jgi:hypothetical protein